MIKQNFSFQDSSFINSKIHLFAESYSGLVYLLRSQVLMCQSIRDDHFRNSSLCYSDLGVNGPTLAFNTHLMAISTHIHLDGSEYPCSL